MRLVIIAILMLAALGSNADTIAMIDRLISRGNHAYDLSQRTRIRECADSAAALLRSGGISRNDSLDLAASICKLYGNFHYENCALDSAEYCYGEAQDIVDNNQAVSFKSLTRLLLLRDRAQLYYLMGDYPLAASLLAQADDILEYNAPYEPGSDEWLITKLSYAICLARIQRFDDAIALAKTELDNAIDKSSLSYAKAQRMYAKILMLSDADRLGALKAYKSYFESQRKFALANFGKMDAAERSEYWQTLQPFVADCYLTEGEDAGFLHDVALFSKGLLLQLSRLSGNDAASDAALRTLGYRWTDIQQRLTPDCVAIEFVEYQKDGMQKMAAIVLKHRGAPAFVPLTSADEIMSIAGRDMASTDRGTKDRLYENSTLQRLIWTDALMKAINGAKRIYFAPDGYLHRLAIEYMPEVADKEMLRLSSTRRLMDKPTALLPGAPALLFGGINYDLDKAPGDAARNDESAYTNYIGKSFPHLSDSSNETKSIYEARSNSADSIVSASNASEGAFAALAPAFESILISTHGDFCSSAPMSTDLKTAGEDAVMSQSIIAFAGVNTYLHDQRFDASSHYDGLLSAKELSGIDLSRCKLFTVSACQSALGTISSDGVFGLQRGLKNAGAEVMLLSLWNVNSDATAKLMNAFYSGLGAGMGIREAFASARAQLISSTDDDAATDTEYAFDPATMSMQPVHKRASHSFSSPQYTHAFILIDALE